LVNAKAKTIDCIHIALEEEYATLLIGDWAAVRKQRCQAETIEHWLFMVVTGNAVLLAEHTAPLVGTLIINAIEALVKNWLNDATESRYCALGLP